MVGSEKFRIAAFCLISLLCYLFIAYGIERSDFYLFISGFVVCFISYFFILKQTVQSTKYLQWGITVALVFRLALLFAIPNLTDDFYRFIWDGNLMAHGLNPFAHKPIFYMETKSVSFLPKTLFSGLNSPNYYTIYPSVCQYIFGLGAQLFGSQLLGNIVVIRLFIIASEAGTIWILKKLLNHFQLNPAYLLIYALNPLIILELTGNLHFEGIMIFFLLLTFYCLLKKRYVLASIFFVLSVNTKLIPLLLTPYLVFSLGWKRSACLVGILIGGSLILYAPFIDAVFLEHFADSLGLYFQSFEFNASIYYLVRWVGFQYKGYNIIQTAGPVLAAISTLLILIISWKYRDRELKNLPAVYIILLAIYYLFATTVHPWYVSSMVAFVPLAGMLFPLAWSAVIPLTYITYISSAYTENLWLIALEYIILFVVLMVDYNSRGLSISNKIKAHLAR